MNTTIRIKANELNEKILEAIKSMFGEQEINISISPVSAKYDTISELEPRMASVNVNGGEYSFSIEEFKRLSNRMQHDKPYDDLLKKAKQLK